MKYILIIIFISVYKIATAQLLYIAKADKDAFYDAQEKTTIYPNLKLKKKIDNTLLYKGDTIYSNRYLSKPYVALQYEIYSNKYLIVTFIDSLQVGHSMPMHVNRKVIHIVKFDKPSQIYQCNVEGKQIAGNIKWLDIYKKGGKSMFVIKCINIENEEFILLGNDKIEYNYKLALLKGFK